MRITKAVLVIATALSTSMSALADMAGNHQDASAAIAFMFDDGHDSQIRLADQFESRNIRFSFAPGNIGGKGRISIADALGFAARGFEFSNHGTPRHLDMRNGSNATYSDAKSEIEGGVNVLQKAGLTPKGFVAPYSELKGEYIPIVRNTSDFAFTIYQNKSTDPSKHVMLPPIDRYRMHRTSIYQHTFEELKAIIDQAVLSKGLAVFYDHDPSRKYYQYSATYEEITRVVDYALSIGVEVILPSEIPNYFSVTDTTKGHSDPN